MKRIVFILSLFSLLFLFSCGIPYIYQINSNDISIRTTTDRETNKTSVTVQINDSELCSSSFNEDYSPEIVLFYIVRDKNSSSQYSSLISSFNSQYCDDLSGASITGLNKFDYTSSSTNETYSMYQFNGNGIIGREYISSDNSFKFDLSFSSELNAIQLDLIRDDGLQDVRYLYRHNGESFTNNSSDYDEYVPSDVSDDVTVYIYATISFHMREYTNIWNKKLSSSSMIYSFKLD